MQEINGLPQPEQVVQPLSQETTAYAQHYIAGLESTMEDLAKQGPLTGIAARDEYGRLKRDEDGYPIMITRLDTTKQAVSDMRAALEASRQGDHHRLGEMLDAPLSRDARVVAQKLAELDSILAPRSPGYDAEQYRALYTYRDPWSGERRLYQPSEAENERAVKASQERQRAQEQAQQNATQYRSQLERIQGMRTELGLPS